METMTIRNVPEPLVENLKTAAKRHRRSMNQQVLFWLEEAAAGSRTEEQDVEAELREIQELRKGARPVTVEEIDVAKKDGRA